MNDFEQVKARVSLKEFANSCLQKSKNGFYCCPICGSGTSGRPNSDGALSIKDDSWKCFSCGRGGDIYELAGLVNNTEDKREQLAIVSTWAGINETRTQDNYIKDKDKKVDLLENRKQEAAYIAKCQETLLDHTEAIEYLEARGFQVQEAQGLGIGYDPGTRRLVLPWAGCDYYHIDRDTTNEQTAKYTKPAAAKVGRQPLYNPDALRKEAFFIVEGVLDALAIQACGFEAVALGGTGARQAVEDMTAKGVLGVAICLLDEDEKGQKAQEELVQLLDSAGFINISANLDNYLDPADAFRADRNALTAYLEKAQKHALQEAKRLELEQCTRILDKFRVFDPADVAVSILNLEGMQEPIPTGLSGLDEILGGGLIPGLYVLGAVSSLGKTTLAVQIADQIAASGQGVVFFTIEQSSKEIVAKSLSRYVSKLHPNCLGFTAAELLNPSTRAARGKEGNAILLDACNAYAQEVAPNLAIQEGKEQPSADTIRDVANVWKKKSGSAPVIFIDYLQLMARPSDRDSDKQATDKNVMNMRQLARDLQTPIIAISSLNRSSYNEGVTLDAFKESGAIEYGADVLLGLQPEGIDERLDNASATKQRREGMKADRENKQATTRDCELKVLKNRHGRTGAKILVTFKTMTSTFEEKEEAAPLHVI